VGVAHPDNAKYAAVIAGLDPAIHLVSQEARRWMPGSARA
jgi:hypothetical protein